MGNVLAHGPLVSARRLMPAVRTHMLELPFSASNIGNHADRPIDRTDMHLCNLHSDLESDSGNAVHTLVESRRVMRLQSSTVGRGHSHHLARGKRVVMLAHDHPFFCPFETPKALACLGNSRKQCRRDTQKPQHVAFSGTSIPTYGKAMPP